MRSFVKATEDYLRTGHPSYMESLYLGYLLNNGNIGHENAVSLGFLSAKFGHPANRIQNAVVVPSRKPPNKHFVGSWQQGIFIIRDENDVNVMAAFYENRIRCETEHLSYLRGLAI